MTQESQNKIIDGVEYTPSDIIQMKRLRSSVSEETFNKYREKVSLFKKHFDVDVGMIMNIK